MDHGVQLFFLLAGLFQGIVVEGQELTVVIAERLFGRLDHIVQFGVCVEFKIEAGIQVLVPAFDEIHPGAGAFFRSDHPVFKFFGFGKVDGGRTGLGLHGEGEAGEEDHEEAFLAKQAQWATAFIHY